MDDNGDIRLADMGFPSITDDVDPVGWRAPELLPSEAVSSETQNSEEGSYASLASDIYAFGCVIIEVCHDCHVSIITC